MAKQLAFKQRVGNGAHVDTHHRFRHAGRQAVKLMGEHILSRTVFASNQHIGVGACHFLHQSLQSQHCFRLSPDHLRRCWIGGSGFQPRFNRAHKRVDQAGIVPRLFHEIKSTVLHSLHRQLHIGVSRKQHNRHIRKFVVDFVKPVQTLVAIVDSSHEIHVEQHGVDAVRQDIQHGFWRRQRHHILKDIVEQQPQR